MQSDMKPLHAVYFAMGLLLVSVVLPLFIPEPGAGSACAGGALGVLIYVARRLRSTGADDR